MHVMMTLVVVLMVVGVVMVVIWVIVVIMQLARSIVAALDFDIHNDVGYGIVDSDVNVCGVDFGIDMDLKRWPSLHVFDMAVGNNSQKGG